MLKKIIKILFPETYKRIFNDGFKRGIFANNIHKYPIEDYKKALAWILQDDTL